MPTHATNAMIAAGLAVFLAVANLADANLDIYFYDDGTSGMAIEISGRLDIMAHTPASGGGAICANDIHFEPFFMCWGSSADATEYNVDHAFNNVLPQNSASLSVGDFPQPAMVMLFDLFAIDSTYDNTEISSIEHLPGTNVAFVRIGLLTTFFLLEFAILTHPHYYM